MEPENKIENSIRQLHATARPQTDKRILEDAFAALEEAAPAKSAETARMHRALLTGRIIKVAAAAAVVVAGIALFFSTPAAKAVELRQVYEALEKIMNVCETHFAWVQPEPIQTIWTSRSLKIRLFKTISPTQPKFVLWDIPNRVRRVKSTDSAPVELVPVSEQDIASFEKHLGRTFGFVPFSDMNNVPAGSQWTRVKDPQVEAVVPGTEVYDLTWGQRNVKVLYYRKVRYFIDARTNLPKRAEFYDKDADMRQLPKEAETYWQSKPEAYGTWELKSLHIITYPTDEEITQLVREIFGPDSNSRR